MADNDQNPGGRASAAGCTICGKSVNPLQIRAVFSYNRGSGKDKKWARQPIFFCFFGFGGQGK
jgi:hypothetical protein